ncbi:MAG: hypothetical protein ABTQ27_08120 [Amaricoccus sp.]|uniref:hypothetical protein n=1 Tax=Amaricoccus sp. TaxID=1872485 RepID=UPI003314D291
MSVSVRTAALVAVLGLAPLAGLAEGLPPETEARIAEELGATDYFDFVWLPSPKGDEALAVVFFPIPGAAGNFDSASGLFAVSGGKTTLKGQPILFGTEPREARFLADRIELVTTMPRPDDPRCCPTGSAHWVIDRQTMDVTKK